MVQGDVTDCSANMDYDSPGSDSVDDPHHDPFISYTVSVSLIVVLTECAIGHCGIIFLGYHCAVS